MTSIYSEYFSYCKKWKKMYGEKTLVLIQVGNFYEIYALKDDDGIIYENNMNDIEKISFLTIAEKKNKYDGKNVLQSGFTLGCFNKFVKIFQENDYILAIYNQDSVGKNTTRSFKEIISPGTFLEDETNLISNITLCIWIEHGKIRNLMNSITIGVSSLDIFTGKTTLCEYTIDYDHSANTYDQLEQLVSVYNPKETILISNMNIDLIYEIKSYIGLNNKKCYVVEYTKENHLLLDYVKNSYKQNYQLKSLVKYYPNVSRDVIETDLIHTYGIALQSFIVLLDYMYEHNCDFIKKLYFPEFTHNKNKLVLANYSLKQLNILNDSRHCGKLSSISNFLNNCLTSMGKRNFLYDLHNPITDTETLDLSYKITNDVLKENVQGFYREQIRDIIDLERFKRFLLMRKIYPKKLKKLCNNIKSIIELANYTSKNNKYIHTNSLNFINDKINNNTNVNTNEICPQKNAYKIINFLEETFDLDLCKNINEMSQDYLSSLEINNLYFIKKGQCSIIDNLLISYSCFLNLRKQIQKELSKLIGFVEKKKSETDYIKCSNSTKSDIELYTTDRRSKLLLNYISNLPKDKKVITITYNTESGNSGEYFLDLEQIIHKNKGNSKTERIITSNQIKELMNNIDKVLSKLMKQIIIFYNSFITDFLNYVESLDIITAYVTFIDVLQNKAYIADKYNYCRPVIETDAKKSFCSVTKLRHPLIEHLQQNELYITNDLDIGRNNFDGLLLYGTNAVGKTSFIRSLGISIIMAQAGLYVPCEAFTYFPYDYIFTRILGNDNLFKGLSTFAVEMCELRTILNNSNENSLILGDELCSGTESSSALSIFTSGLQHLHNNKSTFLFATHFHEIINYEEIKMLNRMKMMHMEVIYDQANDRLVYNRKLKDGPGNSMYGLEVCKSLGLPSKFLENAINIRKNYNYNYNGILNNKTSHFNSEKVLGLCEICNIKKGVDIHHLQFQNRANNENNYIDDFHKNHKANLISICIECHDNIHKNNTQLKITKTSQGYILEKV